jgi:hypothetical protein
MKKTILILLLLPYYNFLVGQTSSDQKDSCDSFLYFLKSKEELIKYIDTPCPNDSTCKEDILKAKAEVQRGIIKFLMPMSLGTLDLRQEYQLRQLCDSNGLIFDYELFSCLSSSGQTNGCYGLYMDKIIAQKFGKDFKENLLKKADSILSESNKRIYWRLCDTKPTIPGKDMWQSCELGAVIDKKLFEKLKSQKLGLGYVNWPTITIGFYIDKNGSPSGYFLSQFDEVNQKSNLEYKSQLYKIGLALVKQQNKWNPGQVCGRAVNTEMEVTVSFIPEK